MSYANWADYEWDVEEVMFLDEYGEELNEVIEHWFQESAADCLKHIKTETPQERCRWDICIVLDTQNDRSWAYVDMDAMTLPEYFENAMGRKTRKVPQRFHKELAKAVEA